ncbi:hypothetical protein BUALT_Bualt05G0001100 [Buddleja alternifolia]|uniref:Uncharacterized protein n=1 Tax=Buddleja alternifolia TaxID=168488 RepID=A0AAV6XFE8_9LAMI|nr:hypothetical protein BUALT_Bualt05G0001100 [Buddleja alternifolia]
MEVEENEEEELAEPCAEILENWTSPICSDLGQNSIHQNRFSLQHPIHPPQLNNAYDDEFIRKVEINPINDPQVSLLALSCSTNLETNDEARTGSDNSTGDMDFDFELEQKPDRVMKERRAVGMALNKTYEKSSKDEPAQKPNDTVSVDRPIIQVLVADTFSDKLLGPGVDGIDIADLNKVKEAKECDEAGDHLRTILNENDAVPEASTLSINNGKEMEKLNFSQRLSGFEEWTRSEVKLNTGVDECLPFTDSNDRGLNDSDVIIEIVKEDDVLADAECANHLLDKRNTENTVYMFELTYTKELGRRSTSGLTVGENILAYRKIKQHHRRSCGKEIVKQKPKETDLCLEGK